MPKQERTSHHPGDRITARIFGQYLTMQRCDWVALAEDLKPSDDPHALVNRAQDIAQRDAD